MTWKLVTTSPSVETKKPDPNPSGLPRASLTSTRTTAGAAYWYSPSGDIVCPFTGSAGVEGAGVGSGDAKVGGGGPAPGGGRARAAAGPARPSLETTPAATAVSSTAPPAPPSTQVQKPH